MLNDRFSYDILKIYLNILPKLSLGNSLKKIEKNNPHKQFPSPLVWPLIAPIKMVFSIRGSEHQLVHC
jgi:hypothetical protein